MPSTKIDADFFLVEIAEDLADMRAMIDQFALLYILINFSIVSILCSLYRIAKW